MKDKKKSKAGKIGSASRWANHEKVITKQIRVYEYDYYLISRLSSDYSSISSFVASALRAYCRCNNIKYSPPSWVD